MADHDPSEDATSNTTGEESGLGEQGNGAVPDFRRPIPDSLFTLSEFMSRMEIALSQPADQSSNDITNIPKTELPLNRGGVPTPDALGIVMLQAQRLISGPAVEALSRIAGRLEDDAGSVDASVRSHLETESMEVGHAMQHLGALFLELGRTIMTLRLGQSPDESSVNAGPAVYISASGPNPIMVQPFPLQTRSLFSGSSPNTNEVAVSGSGSGHYVDAPERSYNVPLGLGPAGLQPKRSRRRSMSLHEEVDVSNALSKALQNPAFSGLLASVSQHPEMRNKVNQIAQQIGTRDVGNMSLGRSGFRSGLEVGGLDLSKRIEQMIPAVSHTLNRISSTGSTAASSSKTKANQTLNGISMGGGAAASSSKMKAVARLESISMRKVQSVDMYSLLDPQQLAQKIVKQSSPREIFSLMVRNNVAELYKYGDGQYSLLNELCSEDGLARDFLQMLRHDIFIRLQEQTGP